MIYASALGTNRRAPRRAPDQREHREAKALMSRVAMSLGAHPELARLFAVPNGGARGKAAAGKAKAEGVKRGVPDYVFPVRRGDVPGLVIELKAMDGAASKEQRDWLKHFRAQGWEAHVAHGWEAAWSVLIEYVRRPA